MKKIYMFVALGLILGLVHFGFPTLSAAAEELKPMTLKLSHTQPEGTWYSQHYKWWAGEVEKRTGGKIKMQIYWMESLNKLKDGLHAVQSRFADTGWITSTYHPSNFPNFMLIDTAYNCGDNYIPALLSVLETIDNEPNVKAELAKNNIVLIVPHNGGQFQIGAKKPINNLEDLKGRTIRTVGGVNLDFYKELGTNPVFMSFMDVYEALDRGTIQAMGNCPIMLSFQHKLQEVIKSLYMVNHGSMVASGLFMNGDLYKSLPKETQDMFMKLRREFALRFAQAQMDVEKENLKEWQTKYGATVKYPTPEEQKILHEAGRKANDIFIKKQEGSGAPNGRKVVDFYHAAFKKYEAEYVKK